MLARIATEPPADGVHDVGGPDKLTFAEMATLVLGRPAIVDSTATYFGTPVTENSLVAGDDAERGSTRLADWLGAR